jgi:uncharacterized protein (TIGR02284 family)
MAPLKELQDLIHLDMDAVSAYQKAIDAIEHEGVAAKLRDFQGDHRRHVADLSAEVTRLGGKPDVRTDVKGFFIGGFTAVTSQGTHSALVAMKGNEQLPSSTYKKALEHKDLPETTKALLQRNYSDEARHLDWIENTLAKKVWEQKATQQA